jgi:uncharacterized small protein (DUF1192 family)
MTRYIEAQIDRNVSLIEAQVNWKCGIIGSLIKVNQDWEVNMKSTNESNARAEMERIWGDVLSPYAVEMHDEQIEVLVDKVDRLEARVKELEQDQAFLIHAEQIAREGLDRRLSALTDRFDKYVFYTEKTLDDVCERWIPGLMDRLNDLEKKA